jgi:hypothetical protein
MAKKHPVKLSAKLEVELRDRLEELLDDHDDVSDKKRRLTRALGSHLKVIEESVSLVRRQLKGQELDQLQIPGTEKPEPAKDPLVAEILRIAGGIVEREPEKESPGDATPGALGWHQEGENLVARAPDGTYCIEPLGTGPFFDLLWTPLEGRSSRVIGGLTKDEAKKAAEQHRAERAADALLKNAGHGALTKADTKGPPIARKKGGRHG